MAQIPMGNFGQSVAQPAPLQRVQSEGAGQVAAEANARLAQTGAGIVIDQMQAQHKLDMEQKDLEARTTAARVRITVANDLADLRDTVGRGVADGSIEKERAEEEWNARAKGLLEGRLQGVDQRFSGPLQAEFEGLTRQGLNGVRDSVVKRDQTETQANLLNLGEQYQRMAARNRPQAISEYFAQIDAMGPRAGWGPDKIAQAKQVFREGTAATQAFAMVRSASRDLGAVRKAREALGGDGFKDIDTQRKAALDAELDRYEMNILQRQEIAAQAASRKREAHLREAGAAFETAQRLIDSGIPLDADEYDRLVSKMAGTPYLDGLKSIQSQARVVGGFAAQSIPEQRQALRDLYAIRSTQGNSEKLSARIDQAEKVLAASETDSKNLGIEAFARRHPGVKLDPIDTTSVDGFIRSISPRLSIAREASVWSGKPESPVMNDEAEALAGAMGTLPVQQRATALGTLGRRIGPQAAAGLAAQIDKKDKALALALQFGTSATTEGRTTAEIILKGQQALKDRTVKVETMAVDGWRSSIAKEVDGAYSNQKQAEDVKEAAFLIMAGLESERSGRSYKEAVGLAARGRIVEHNGKRIPLPAEMEQDQFDDRLRAMKPADFSDQARDGQVYVGAQPVPLNQFVQSLPDAQLMHAGKDRYTVLSGGRVVTNSRGIPIIIKGR